MVTVLLCWYASTVERSPSTPLQALGSFGGFFASLLEGCARAALVSAAVSVYVVEPSPLYVTIKAEAE